NSEMRNRVVALVGHVKAEKIGAGGEGYGIRNSRRDSLVDLTKRTGLGIRGIGQDLARAAGSGARRTGDEYIVDGHKLAPGQQTGCCKANCGGQGELAGFAELHALPSLRANPTPAPENLFRFPRRPL